MPESIEKVVGKSMYLQAVRVNHHGLLLTEEKANLIFLPCLTETSLIRSRPPLEKRSTLLKLILILLMLSNEMVLIVPCASFKA